MLYFKLLCRSELGFLLRELWTGLSPVYDIKDFQDKNTIRFEYKSTLNKYAPQILGYYFPNTNTTDTFLQLS